MKKMRITVVLVILSLAFSFFPSAATQAQSNGFDTPEAVVEAFVAAVAVGDSDAALATFATALRAEHYDFAATIERQKVYSLSLYQPAPSNNAYYRRINQAFLEGHAARSLLSFTMSFLAEESLLNDATEEVDGEWAESFAQSVDPALLKDLTLLRLEQPYPDESELISGAFEAIAAREGADEVAECIALYKLNDELFIGGFRLLRYGDEWCISFSASELSDMPPSGTVIPCADEAEFNQKLADVIGRW